MSRLIDADKLKKHYAWWNNEEKKVFDDIVDLQPTVDAEKHGYWVWENYLTEGSWWLCSECGDRFETPYPYCPNCGARMDETCN